MSYYMADRKHRKAFLEARQSLEVKLNLEEQSQQQVRAEPGLFLKGRRGEAIARESLSGAEGACASSWILMLAEGWVCSVWMWCCQGCEWGGHSWKSRKGDPAQAARTPGLE